MRFSDRSGAARPVVCVTFTPTARVPGLIGVSPDGNQIYVTSIKENRVIALSFAPAPIVV